MSMDDYNIVDCGSYRVLEYRGLRLGIFCKSRAFSTEWCFGQDSEDEPLTTDNIEFILNELKELNNG